MYLWDSYFCRVLSSFETIFSKNRLFKIEQRGYPVWEGKYWANGQITSKHLSRIKSEIRNSNMFQTQTSTGVLKSLFGFHLCRMIAELNSPKMFLLLFIKNHLVCIAIRMHYLLLYIKSTWESHKHNIKWTKVRHKY